MGAPEGGGNGLGASLELERYMQEALRYNQRLFYFPEKGPYRRELYKKHMEFFRATAEANEVAAVCANRVGKTESMVGYALMCFLTGLYPSWWEGRVFKRPIRAWMAGEKRTMIRDIQQRKLLGPMHDLGSGLIPKSYIIDYTPFPGLKGCIETVIIKNKFGGYSELTTKSYNEGWFSFQGDEQDVIALDEEPSMEIYAECLTRTLTTKGLVMMGFTPLQGLSEVVTSFLADGKNAEVIYSPTGDLHVENTD